MKNLYFLSSYGEKRLVRENIDPETTIGYINEYVAQLNPKYKIYYVRTWETPEGTKYDIGSHSEFFLVGE